MTNFGGLPEEFSKEQTAAIVILPVPYDGTSTWIKGADKGPQAINEASANMELYDIETDSEVYLRGIHTAAPVTEASGPEKMSASVYERAGYYLDRGKYLVVTGGEHSVSIGSMKAFAERYNELTFLQIDAHSDMRNEYEGSGHNHACVMARASEMAPVVQVGIRAVDSAELSLISTEKVFFAHQIHDNDKWMDRAVSMLTENVYLTIDLDALDPSIMPSTGTPEPGGMGWYQTLEFIRRVIASKNLVGFDVVELCPSRDNKAPDFLAAKLIYRILSMQFAKERT
ncbi:MAG: agmatinase [Marinilabiliales bacterium]|nr:MAG: agmatinase [Marinilabiliales bacterium]